MIKIYLASMYEPENFGSGKVYAIARTKPDELEVTGLYSHLTPNEDILNKYVKMKLMLSEHNENALKEASDYFNKAFYEQLKEFLISLNKAAKAAKEENKTMIELLPFEDGDTLVSQERFGFSNYRGMVGGCLKKIGYEVIVK